MFAGAVREAVLSNPTIIQRLHAGFIPVALKAGFLQNPPDSDEGRLYREIARSRPAPQGICIINSAGKVLDWALMFDDDKSVLGFLNHSAVRYARFPDAKQPVIAERYMKFPSRKLPDVADSGKILAVPDRHPQNKRCPATPFVPQGTLVARLFGRALDKDGRLKADTVPQENYVEDRFEVPVGMQETLAQAITAAGAQRFRLPDDLARLLASHAYLGQLDVLPISPPGSIGNLKTCALWAKAEHSNSGLVLLHIAGNSEAGGAMSEGQAVGDGRFLQHYVNLQWHGTIKMKEKRISHLLFAARGIEKLKSGKINLPLNHRADVSMLPGGHAIDLNCGVRYGIIGEPVTANNAAPAELTAQTKQESDVLQLIDVLGPPFQIFREKVQEELKLSYAQKQRMQAKFPDCVQETRKVFEKFGDRRAEERDTVLQSYRQQAQEKLDSFLRASLNGDQLKRLRELELQQEGAFALVTRPDIGNELKVTNEQRTQFMAVIQELQQSIEPIIRQTQSGGNPQEIGPVIKKIHKEQERRIDAVLSDRQRTQWKAMRGKPFDLAD